MARGWGNTRESLASGRIAIMGSVARVNARTFTLVSVPAPFAGDRSRTMWYQSLLWAVPLLYPGPAGRSTAAMRAGVLRALSSYRDPGSASTTALRRAKATGWDEGTNTRREQALNCILPASGWNPNLVSALRATVSANLDMTRYYGPPKRPVHNHATMANLALLDSAVVLSTPRWARVAMTRLRAEIPGIFTPTGFTVEQSSKYQVVNRALWCSAAARIAAEQPQVDLRRLYSILTRATAVVAHLTAPTGRLVQLGDGGAQAPRLTAPRSLVLTDRAGGLLTRRWSWSDPGTTFVTQRFGLRRAMHGHFDHTSFTLTTLGSDVIVDLGSYSYDPRSLLANWAESPAGHNLAVPAGARVVGGSSLSSVIRSGSRDTSVVVSRMFSVPVTRTLSVDNRTRTVVVRDVSRIALVQHFHLARGWTYRSRTNRSMVFAYGTLLLRVSVQAGSSLAYRSGSRSPIAGWAFPSYERAVPATEVLVRGGRSIQTTLTVTRRTAR